MSRSPADLSTSPRRPQSPESAASGVVPLSPTAPTPPLSTGVEIAFIENRLLSTTNRLKSIKLLNSAKLLPWMLILEQLNTQCGESRRFVFFYNYFRLCSATMLRSLAATATCDVYLVRCVLQSTRGKVNWVAAYPWSCGEVKTPAAIMNIACFEVCLT